MNKKIITLAVSALAMTFMTGCNSSTGIDKDIKLFLDGIEVNVPSLNKYKLEYETFFSYEYQDYAIGGSVKTDKALDEEYAKLFDDKTGLVSANDEDYPVEEYGYVYLSKEKDPLVELHFYVEEGSFEFVLWRNDGTAGKLDVSKVDTSWYVDYVRDYGCTLSDQFPGSDIKTKLGLNIDLVAPVSTKYVYLYIPADEDYEEPAGYAVLVDGDIASSYATALTSAGYTVTSEEREEFFSDETYLVYTAYDSTKDVYLEMMSGEVFTQITYRKFSDMYTSTLTDRTDWTDEEKAAMTSFFGEPLPFIQLGSDYVAEGYTFFGVQCFSIEDTYYLNRTAELEAYLVSAGFVLDGDYGVYIKQIAGYEIEAECGYYEGNYIEFYKFALDE